MLLLETILVGLAGLNRRRFLKKQYTTIMASDMVTGKDGRH